MPALLGTAIAQTPAGEEYDLDLPSDPNQGQGGDGGTEASDAGAEPAAQPAPVGESSDPTGSAASGGNGADDAGSDGEDGAAADQNPQHAAVIDPGLASGTAAGDPTTDEGFPTVAVALAAAAVLAVPFGIWLMRRRRA